MNTAIQWFIWQGAIFKVPLSTLQLPKEAGGRALIHIMAKCMTLFTLRMEKHGQQKAAFTTDGLTRWHLHERTPNPPQIKRIPAKFDYLYRYNIEAAYTSVRVDSENHKSHKKKTLHSPFIKHTCCGWTPWNAYTKTMAQHRQDTKMEEFKGRPSFW